MQEWKREHFRPILSRYWDGKGLADLPPELRGGHRWPLEALRDPKLAETRQAAGRNGRATVRRRLAAGELHRPQPQPRDRTAALAKAQAHRRERLQDPEHRAEVSRHIAAGRAAGRRPEQRGATPRPCLVCGEPFISRTGRRTCSDACEAARRRSPRKERLPVACAVCGAPFISTYGRKTCTDACARRLRETLRAQHPQVLSPDTREKLRQRRLEGRRALAPSVAEVLAAHGAARLSPRDREMTARFYGLADGRLWPPAELTAAYGLTEDGVRLAVRKAVAKLLAGAAGHA